MSFDALIRSLVPVADALTADLQADIVHRPVTFDANGDVVTSAPYGEPSYGSAANYTAVWEDEAQLIRQPGGLEVLATGKLTFLQPGLVIDERDELTVNGKVTPIFRVDKGVRSRSGTYVLTVWLGASNAATAGGQ